MVQYYDIAGRRVGSHYLAMGVLGVFFSGIGLAARGRKTVSKEQGPPIDAQSPDEEKFIKDFLKNAEEKKNGAKH